VHGREKYNRNRFEAIDREPVFVIFFPVENGEKYICG